jgi:hypothetical protein
MSRLDAKNTIKFTDFDDDFDVLRIDGNVAIDNTPTPTPIEKEESPTNLLQNSLMKKMQ